jgi:hypothetical protein
MILVANLILLTSLFLVEPPLSVSNPSSYESQVIIIFDEVIEGVEKMRGLHRPDSTELNIVSIQWFKDQETEKVENESDKIDIEDIVYKALFILPQNHSIGSVRVEQAGRILSAVAGSQLYVVKEYFDPEDSEAAKRTLAHEVVHLLQSKFKAPSLTTFDQRQSWIALIEGDADFTADTYMETLAPLSYREPVPGSLDKINGFPYRYGSGFISTLFSEGGWNLINSVYDNVPRSTEEILHPDIFLTGGSLTNTDNPLSSSSEWEGIWTNTFGEYFIRVMLENGVSADNAIIASSGWRSDNITLFHNSMSYLVSWRITWDTPEDSSEFFEYYGKMIGNMDAIIVEPDLYYLHGHYLIITETDDSTDIFISKDLSSIISAKELFSK